MPNVHRLANRGFRPDPPESYAQAKTNLAGTGLTMNQLLSAFLRWFGADPTGVLSHLAPHLKRPDQDPPVGSAG